MNIQKHLKIKQLHLVAGHIEKCGQWNHQEWGQKLGYSLEQSIDWARQVTFSLQGEFAVIALWDGAPVGMSFLESHDANERPALTPWLSGVYVEPGFRYKGIATGMIKTIEDLAHNEGFREIYLHTPNAEDLYTRLGWQSFDEFEREKTGHHVVMRKRLGN